MPKGGGGKQKKILKYPNKISKWSKEILEIKKLHQSINKKHTQAKENF